MIFKLYYPKWREWDFLL